MSNKYAELKEMLLGKFDAEEIDPLKIPKEKIEVFSMNRRQASEDPGAPTELVEHPPHYNQGQYETIDVIEDWGLDFHCGNAIKYISRHKHKGQPIRDIKKAIWYLNRYLASLEEQK